MLRVGLNAHLLSERPGYRAAGVSHYIANLLAYLPQEDPATAYHAFLSPRHSAPTGWATHRSRWATEAPSRRILWEQACQPWVARRLKLDLLHVPVYVGPLVKPCPLVVTVHDLSFFLYPELFRPGNRAYLQRMTRHTVLHAEGVLADSGATRDDMVRVLGIPAERVTVIHAGVDEAMRPVRDAEALAALRRRYALPERYILFLGTLEPRKNVTTLLEAYALLRQRHGLPHALVIAGGKGWYYEAIEAAVTRLGLQGAVILPGFVPQEDLPALYSAAELFVYPSLYEGFGIPPLEAMACGTPVITSDTSSLPEVVGDAALTLPPTDHKALAEAMAELLQDDAHRQVLVQAGLRRAQELTWRRMARETAAFYHRLLGEMDGV